jgi:hypothetical protein
VGCKGLFGAHIPPHHCMTCMLSTDYNISSFLCWNLVLLWSDPSFLFPHFFLFKWEFILCHCILEVHKLFWVFLKRGSS